MSTNSLLLDNPQHARIFADKVVPDSEYHQTTPQAAPRAIIIAGQPGAGKGRLVKDVQKELRNNVVIIATDEQRDNVPGIKKMRDEHPLTWSEESHSVAKAYANGLRDFSIDGRHNILIDTTLTRAKPVIEQIKIMQGKGYQVEIRAVATHRLESELGIDLRYAEDLIWQGYGLHFSSAIHNFTYQELPYNLNDIHKELPDVRIYIFDRSGVMHYDSLASRLEPGEELKAAREARMRNPKIVHVIAQIGRAQQVFHQKLPEILESLTSSNGHADVQNEDILKRFSILQNDAPFNINSMGTSFFRYLETCFDTTLISPPRPPVPPRMCEMLKDYPRLIQIVQDDLAKRVERLLQRPHFPAFEEIVWALESLFSRFLAQLDDTMRDAEASGDQQAIEQTRKMRNLISRIRNARPWNDEGEGTLWEYFQIYKGTFE